MIKRGPNGLGIKLDITSFVNLLITVVVIIATTVTVYYKTSTKVQLELVTISTDLKHIKSDIGDITECLIKHDEDIDELETNVSVIKNEIGMGN